MLHSHITNITGSNKMAFITLTSIIII